MKRIHRLLILSGVLFVKPVWAAIFPDYTPLIPVAPQICAQCTPATISTVVSTLDQMKAMEEKLHGANLLKLAQQSATSYAVNLGKSKFNTLKQKITQKKKVVSASRVIEDSTLTVAGDISDEGKVKEAFITLFLQYPSKNGSKKREYEEKGKQLSMDTTLEMYITARELSKELTTMTAQLAKVENCLVGGEDCTDLGLDGKDCQSEGKEDKVCIWNNALAAVRIYDKIMRYNEFLTAMNAQYDAVRSLGGTVKIKEYAEDKKSDKQSFLEDRYKQNGAVTNYAYNTTILAAASIDESTVSDASDDDDSGFDTLDDAGLESPVAGKEQEFESLEVIADAKKAMNEAVTAHNFKQSLPQYRNVFEMYHNMEAYQEKAEENVNTSIQCIINYLSHYYNSPKFAWFGADCNRKGGKYLCHYMPEKAFSDKSSSAGDFDVACDSEKEQKCYVVQHSTDIKTTSGIAQWLAALSASVRDEEETSGENVYENGNDSIYMSEAIDFSGSGNTSLSDQKNKANEEYAKDNKGTNVRSLKQPSMEETLYSESRANALLNWTLGKQTSEMVNKEYIAQSNTFGTTKTGNSLWNDQKYFYDTYINGKYENMKAYVKNITFVDLLATTAQKINKIYQYTTSRDETGRVSKTAEQQRKEASEQIDEFSLSFVTEPDITKIKDKLMDEQNALTKITEEYLNKVASLKSQKNEIYKTMDEYSTKFSDVQDAINNAKSTINSADTETPKSEDAIEEGKKLERGITVSPQRKGFNKNISQNNADKEDANKKLGSMELSSDKLKKQIDAARAKLEEIDNNIYQAKADYVLAYDKAQSSSQQDIDKAVQDYEKARKEYVAKVKTAVSKVKVLGVADALLEVVKAKALEEIDEAHQKILALGDNMYLESGAKEIQKIHRELLEKLQDLQIKPKNGEFGKYGEYIAEYNKMFAPLAQDKMKEDEEYFWGLVAQDKDFFIPKSPLNFSSAPLREVFHFDLDDYDAVLKYLKDGVDSTPENNKDVTLVGNSLLLSGLQLPDIWVQMLANRPYVERRIDFDKLFHQKGADNTEVLAGSGIYPCVMSKNVMNKKAVTATIDGYATANNASQECSNLVSDRDVEADAPVFFQNRVDTKNWKSASELGQILDYVVEVKMISPLQIEKVGHLSFNNALLKAVSEIKKSDKIDESESASRDYYLYSRFLLDRNQFGDYLDMVDINTEAQKALALQKTQVDELRAQVKDILNKIGYDISDDFDLSNEDDYKKISDTLKNYKTAYLRRFTDLLQSITGTTELINTNRQKLLHAKQVLEKDNEEQVSISGEEDLDELTEKIKTAKADEALTDVYEKEGSKSMLKQLKQLRPPYCAAYPY